MLDKWFRLTIELLIVWRARKEASPTPEGPLAQQIENNKKRACRDIACYNFSVEVTYKKARKDVADFRCPDTGVCEKDTPPEKHHTFMFAPRTPRAESLGAER